MKKFTFLLSLLGLSASSAFAGVFVPSTDGNTHVYAIKNPGVAGNYYCNLNGSGIGSTQRASDFAYFIIEAGSAEGQYYMKCLSNNKYVSYTDTKNDQKNKISFVDTKDTSKQWKIVKESGSDDNYDIIPSEVDATNTKAPSWNWHGGIGNNIGFYNANDGASTWTFVEATTGKYTFNYFLDGTKLATKTTSTTIVGTDKSAAPTSGVNFTRVESMNPANIEAGTTTYTVNLAEDLPFTKSTSFDNAIWYVMDIHGNHGELPSGKQYVWTYQTDNSVKFPRTNLSTDTYSDNMLWCFVGDLMKGFKIYNKAAGSSLTLRKATDGETLASMSDQNGRNIFKIFPTNETTLKENGFCFKIQEDNYYLNAPGKNDDKSLKGYIKPDGGSTCRVFVPGSAIIDNALTNYRKVYTKAENALANAVGTNSYLETGSNYDNFVTSYDAIQNAIQNNTATVEQINALINAKNGINTAAANETTIEAGKSYRLYNAKNKKYLYIKLYNGGKNQFNNKNVMSTKADKGNSVLSVVTFEKDSETGRFHMMMGGKTLGKRVGDDFPILLEDATSENKGSYRVDHVGTTFRFYDQTSNVSNRSYLHCNNQNDSNDSNLCGWDAPLTEINPSLWHVVPATTAEIDMNLVDGKSYATAYLPYAVSKVEGAEVYTGTLSATNDALDMTQIKGGIPANQGVVLVGTAAKATLTIGESTAKIESNSLVGTNLYIPFTTETPRDNYLVFGKNEGNVGFYIPSAKVPSIPANKAYLNKPASSSIVMNFGGNTTGVNTVVLGENGVNAPVFDLSGRRVVAPVKGGVYIQNGKKFIK